MGHNVYSHLESVQRANELTDAVRKQYSPSYTDWTKIKSGSKEDQFDPWVPRNVVYMTSFIEQLFESETPMQMLDDAAPMLANFNGVKSLSTTGKSTKSLFTVKTVLDDVTNEEFSDEDLENANNIMENMEA
jgi:hypothetical protein